MKRLIQQLNAGTIKFRDLDNLTDSETAKEVRLQFIAARTKLKLKKLGELNFRAESTKNRNIENLIGSVEIPLGVAGPIKVNGENADGEYMIPLATTEGTLVASTGRGCKLLNMAGGVTTTIKYVGMTRAPLFKLEGIRDASRISNWVVENFPRLNKIAREASSHISLLKIEPFQLGRLFWLRMNFDTDEAMGMNMSTKAAQMISGYIADTFKIKLISISGNLCADKKPALINQLLGRGIWVQAECLIKREMVIEVLHTTPEELTEVNTTKVWQGSALAGSNSYNAHFANIISAIFAATGQDLAHVVNSSQGYSVFEVDKGDLYVAVSLPSLLIGYVGGGTCLPKQALAKELILAELGGKAGKGRKSFRMAEVTAAAVLAGELSLHAALASQELVAAHEKLGKGKQ